MNLLVCGGREFTDYKKLDLAILRLPFLPLIIIEGGARGADRLAREWGIKNNVHYAEVPALWDGLGNSAGHRRNSAMLLLKVDYCIALPGNDGTQSMIDKCKSAGVTVWEPYK